MAHSFITVVMALNMYITAMPARIMLTGETFLVTDITAIRAVGMRANTKAFTTMDPPLPNIPVP